MMRRMPAALLTLLAGVLAACGGGGGGGGAIPGGSPIAPSAVTLLNVTSSGAVGGSLAGSSPDGVLLVQSPTTPAEPSTGGTLTEFSLTASETAAVVPGSVRRSVAARTTVAQRTALAQRIVEDRAFRRADMLRERAPSTASLRTLFARAGARAAARAHVRTPSAVKGTIGTIQQFKILTSNIGNSGGCVNGTMSGTYICFTTITATLEAAGAHGNVWVDNASLATAGEFSNVPAEFQTVAADFDQYYATETAAFGPAFFPSTGPVTPTYSAQQPQCDASGNTLPMSQWATADLSGATGTSIDIVITDALAGTGEGGYYYVVNEIPQAVWNCAPVPKPVSNGTSMVVITGNDYLPTAPGLPQFNEGYWLNTDVPRGLSHELQHLLHAHNKVLLPEFSGTGNATFDDAFIDEGCSMLAEDLAADGVHIDTPRFAYSFLLEPSLFSLTAFTGYQPNPTSTATNPPYGFYSNTAGSYGQAYLFMRYLYDRFGPSALKNVYASTGPTVAPAVAAANGEPFPQLYREFAAAVATQSSAAAQTPYAFSSAIVLRGTVTVPSRRTAPLNVRTLVIGGPQPPETFAANLPTANPPLSPGATLSTFVIDGGTLFLPATNGPSGATLGITGAPFPTEQGALIQGVLPTPTPASS